ncbi:MAG: hypothetical protein MR298_07480 [Odoribacter sp.]|nr:hypothetical protein [Odoribacter sp.]MDY3032317.1 hypothetical protein [Odoribacter sp.]
MKYILMCILFLVMACSWWTGKEDCRLEETQDIEYAERYTGEAEQQEDKIVSVLMAANKCADVSVHTHGSFFSQMARRYRSLGSCWEKLFENLVYGQGNCLHTTFKITSVLSDECDARLKNAGYYIYTLRKIII